SLMRFPPRTSRSVLPTVRSLLLASVIFPISPSLGLASDFRAGSTVSLGPTATFPSNLYVAARHATISADVHGDFVAACQELFIQGNVSNDVAIAASPGSLSGHVGGDVRSVAGDLNVSGHIDGDLVVAAGRVHLLP